MAGCLGEEAEKTGKGTGRERIWHSAQRCVYVCVCVGVNAREYRCSTERQGLMGWYMCFCDVCICVHMRESKQDLFYQTPIITVLLSDCLEPWPSPLQHTVHGKLH